MHKFAKKNAAMACDAAEGSKKHLLELLLVRTVFHTSTLF